MKNVPPETKAMQNSLLTSFVLTGKLNDLRINQHFDLIKSKVFNGSSEFVPIFPKV